MVKSTDLWNLNNPVQFVRLNCSIFWCVLIQRQVRAGFVIVAEIIFEQSAQMIVIENDHMIQAFATDASILWRSPLCGAEARAARQLEWSLGFSAT